MLTGPTSSNRQELSHILLISADWAYLISTVKFVYDQHMHINPLSHKMTPASLYQLGAKRVNLPTETSVLGQSFFFPSPRRVQQYMGAL